MADCGDLLTNQDLSNAKKDATTINDYVESDQYSIVSKNGKVIRTLEGTRQDAQEAIDSFKRTNKGDYSSGPLTLEDGFEYTSYTGDGKDYFAVTPPYTTDPVTYPDPSLDPNLTSLSYVLRSEAVNFDNDRQKETTGISEITEASIGLDIFPLIGEGLRVAGVGLWVVPSVTADGSPMPNPANLDAVPSDQFVTINGGENVVLEKRTTQPIIYIENYGAMPGTDAVPAIRRAIIDCPDGGVISSGPGEFTWSETVISPNDKAISYVFHSRDGTIFTATSPMAHMIYKEGDDSLGATDTPIEVDKCTLNCNRNADYGVEIGRSKNPKLGPNLKIEKYLIAGIVTGNDASGGNAWCYELKCHDVELDAGRDFQLNQARFGGSGTDISARFGIIQRSGTTDSEFHGIITSYHDFTGILQLGGGNNSFLRCHDYGGAYFGYDLNSGAYLDSTCQIDNPNVACIRIRGDKINVINHVGNDEVSSPFYVAGAKGILCSTSAAVNLETADRADYIANGTTRVFSGLTLATNSYDNSTITESNQLSINGTLGVGCLSFGNTPTDSNTYDIRNDLRLQHNFGSNGEEIRNILNVLNQQSAYQEFQTLGSRRFKVGKNNAEETGSDAGSNYDLDAYDDNGDFLYRIFRVFRNNSGQFTHFTRVVFQDDFLQFNNLPVYVDDAAAGGGGLAAGRVYQTPTGELRIKL